MNDAIKPLLEEHNLVTFVVNEGWMIIRRREYIDLFIEREPYNSVTILFHMATKVCKSLL